MNGMQESEVDQRRERSAKSAPGDVSELRPAALERRLPAVGSERAEERYALHTQYINATMVRLLRLIGYDVGFCCGKGQYLFDRAGDPYLDLVSGWGVFGIGRNHPALRATLTDVLASDLPNLPQMDVSTLSGLLAEQLL